MSEHLKYTILLLMFSRMLKNIPELYNDTMKMLEHIPSHKTQSQLRTSCMLLYSITDEDQLINIASNIYSLCGGKNAVMLMACFLTGMDEHEILEQAESASEEEYLLTAQETKYMYEVKAEWMKNL